MVVLWGYAVAGAPGSCFNPGSEHTPRTASFASGSLLFQGNGPPPFELLFYGLQE